MCGLSGFFIPNYNNKDNFLENIKKMVNALSHRGPDFSNFQIFENMNLAIGHNRLSILDLSEKANQPFFSNSKRYCIVYNGEIYNFFYLKKLIESKKIIKWKSTSDTEVLIEAIELFGIDKSLELIEGMFAFCLVDLKSNLFYIVRDHFGQKPIYYSHQNNNFFFASELKSLKKNEHCICTVDKKAIYRQLKYNFIPDPNSIYENIYKLEAGNYICFNIEQKKYKKIKYYYYKNNFDVKTPYNEKINQLDELLSKSVKKHCISDVDTGSYLSGGLDSSLISCIYSNHASGKINTITVGFDFNKSIDLKLSRKISSFLNTDHNEINLSDRDCLTFIKDLPQIFDEPFSDISQLPSVFLSKFARSKVKVVLSGDGGDEFFGGYRRHIFYQNYQKYNFKTPKIINKIISNAYKLKKNISGMSSEKLNKILNTSNLNDFYFNSLSNNLNFEKLIKLEIDFNEDNIYKPPSLNNLLDLDLLFYFSGDIMVKNDRSSMAFGLEQRSPYLDKNIHSFSKSLRDHEKIKYNEGKVIIRDLIKKYLPKDYILKKKIGFTPPISKWLKSELKDWSYDMLSKQQLAKHNYFNYEYVNKIQTSHLNSSQDFGKELWAILMFQSWYDSNT